MIEGKPPNFEEMRRQLAEELARKSKERQKQENIIRSLEGQLAAARRRGDHKKAKEAKDALGKLRYGKKKEKE